MNQQASVEGATRSGADRSARATSRRAGSHGAGEPDRPRVAVIERFAVVAEAVGLTLKQSCEALPVPLQPCSSAADAYDAVRRTRAEVVVLIVSPGEVIDLLTLVEQLSADGI